MKQAKNTICNLRLNKTIKSKASNVAQTLLQLNEDQFELENADSDKMAKIISKIVLNERK